MPIRDLSRVMTEYFKRRTLDCLVFNLLCHTLHHN